MTEFIAGCHIFGLILIALAGKTAFTQDCPHYPQVVTALGSYVTPITSPNYPLNYSDNLECSWRIQIEDKLQIIGGYVLKVIFFDFELQGDNALSSISCPFDYLKFYNGWSVSSHLGVGSYCGTLHPEVIYSSGKYLFVKFHTDSNSTFRGFSIGVSVVKEEEASGFCRISTHYKGGHYIIKGSSGTIFTPYYPVPYPDHTNCIWTIFVPVGKRVKLKFVYFLLGKNVIDASYNNFCKYYELSNGMDFVEIHDGDLYDSPIELGSYCGNRTSMDIYSSGRSMSVTFQALSNGVRDQGKRGFKAHFEAVDLLFDKELCLPGNQNNLNLSLTGSHGTLQSPLDYYPMGLYCEWVITVPEGNIVELTFDRFDLDVGSSEWCDDYVEVYDGRSRESETLESDCGSTIPAPVKSSGRYMRVRFQADREFNKPHRGFKATFKAVNKHKTLALAVGITAGVIFVIVLACCVFHYVKRRKTPNEAAGAGIQMSAITTSASHTIQPGVGQHSPSPSPRAPHQQAGNPCPSPSVGYAPLPTNPPVQPPEYPYPLESPPPYPGEEHVPQYPPPGQSYPWQQSSGSAPVPGSS